MTLNLNNSGLALLCYCYAALIIEEILKWNYERFAAIVTDNAANMVKTRRLVLQRFPHLVEVRYNR